MGRRKPAEVVELLTVAEAAKILGVNPATLRRWDELGKFEAQRHPINNYRMYRRDQVETLLEKIRRGEPI